MTWLPLKMSRSNQSHLLSGGREGEGGEGGERRKGKREREVDEFKIQRV